MIWPCTFCQDWWWFIRSLVFGCCFNFAMWNISPIDVKFRVFLSWLTKWTGFCFCYFFVSFLWWSQAFGMWLCCFPVRIQNANGVRQSEHPWWNSWWSNFGLFLCEAWGYQSKNFFVGQNWACGRGMFWPRKDFPLRCFIDAVVNNTLDVLRQNIRADLGRTFSASAALPMMRLTR